MNIKKSIPDLDWPNSSGGQLIQLLASSPPLHPTVGIVRCANDRVNEPGTAGEVSLPTGRTDN
jgi:hypothetical protein